MHEHVLGHPAVETQAAAEPAPEAEHPRSPADMDAEPGPASPVEIDAGASTETTSKVPGQQGWSRKPSTLGKSSGKASKGEGKAKKAKQPGGAP